MLRFLFSAYNGSVISATWYIMSDSVMDFHQAQPLLSPFVVILLAHFYLIKSLTSSLQINDDSSVFSSQQNFWNYIGTRSKVPCVPLTIRNCKEINIKCKYDFICSYRRIEIK